MTTTDFSQLPLGTPLLVYVTEEMYEDHPELHTEILAGIVIEQNSEGPVVKRWYFDAINAELDNAQYNKNGQQIKGAANQYSPQKIEEAGRWEKEILKQHTVKLARATFNQSHAVMHPNLGIEVINLTNLHNDAAKRPDLDYTYPATLPLPKI
jgi:hypothetical protein